MSEINLFAEATRRKLRFPTVRGDMDIERLWDMPLRSKDGFNLDEVAKAADEARASKAKSFVDKTKTSPTQTRAELTMAVVEYVIKVKLDEEEAATKQAENKKRLDRLMMALDEKQAGKLSTMSEEDLQKEIAALRSAST